MTIDNAQALSEWFSRVYGLIIGCGEASALVVRHIVNGESISTDELTQLIKNAIANHQTVGSHYAQTAANVQWDLAQGGVKSHVIYSPGNNLQSLLDNALSKNEPVIIGTNYGAALTHENPGLRGHFVTIVGKDNSGNYVTADPNTQEAVTGKFTINTLSQLKNSNPFAVVIPDKGGSGNGNDPCGPEPDHNDTLNYLKWLMCHGALGIGGAPGNVLSNLGNDIAGGISSGANSIMQNIFKSLGISGGRDLLWRIALILLAIILLLIGILAISKDFIAGDESSKPEVIPVPV